MKRKTKSPPASSKRKSSEQKGRRLSIGPGRTWTLDAQLVVIAFAIVDKATS